jgi:ATP-dependent Clp protease ATP-binding subunit ClpC
MCCSQADGPLESVGITEEAARQQVEEIVGRGQPGQQRGHFLYTPQAKKALELSLHEAKARGDASVGTGHLLLGLIGVGDGPAAQVLNRPGLDLDRVRQRVIEQTAANPGKDDPDTGRQ